MSGNLAVSTISIYISFFGQKCTGRPKNKITSDSKVTEDDFKDRAK